MSNHPIWMLAAGRTTASLSGAIRVQYSLHGPPPTEPVRDITWTAEAALEHGRITSVILTSVSWQPEGVSLQTLVDVIAKEQGTSPDIWRT